jgi:hypothetical protein
MAREDEKNGQSSYSIKSRNVGEAAWVLGVA